MQERKFLHTQIRRKGAAGQESDSRLASPYDSRWDCSELHPKRAAMIRASPV